MKTWRNVSIFTLAILMLPWLGKFLDVQTQNPPEQQSGMLIGAGLHRLDAQEISR